MKALIIAAGRGSRLHNLTNGKPKSLTKLLGVSLIERIILTAKKAGVKEFVIVIGYKGEEIKKNIGNGKKLGVTVDYVENNEWQKENGISVLKAKELLHENFILLMSDHIFNQSILKKLKNEIIANDEVMLAVDYGINNHKYIDMHDVTKVQVKNGRIFDIGKDIKNYNAYDTGIFFCPPTIFNFIEISIQNGDGSLSGGIREMAHKRKAKVFDIKNNYWIDVDNETTFKKAESLLKIDYK